MGFGILFLGYFATTMMSIPLSRMLPVDLGGFIKLFGYILIIIAAKKLSDYNEGFMKLIPSACVMALISAFEGFLDVTVFLSINQIVEFPFSNALIYLNDSKTVDYLSFIATIYFVAALCLAIKQIAVDTEVKKIEIASTRNFVFYCIFFVVQAVSFMPFEWVTVYKPVFVASLLIIELLCWILNLYMIFSCYAKICDSGDVEMKQKPSRFDFINQKREEQERERQQIIEEYEQNAAEKKKKKKKK